MAERTFTLPARFWQDHCDRACRCSDRCPDKDAHEDDYGTPVKGGIKVTLTDIDRIELLSDAEYYADEGVRVFGVENLGLISSARATVKRLRLAATIEAVELR